MMMRTFLALFAALVLGLPATASLPAAKGEHAWGEKAVREPKLRLPPNAPAPRARLPQVSPAERALVQEQNERRGVRKALMIGVNRAVDGAQAALPAMGALEWTSVEGGQAARFAVESPDAAALRLGLDLRGVHLDVEMVFAGADASRLMGPIRVGDIADRTGTWWSPVTEGATQVVELFVPAGVPPGQSGLRVTEVSHLFTGPSTGFDKRTSDIGAAASCHLDIACKQNAPQGFLNARNSVAKMVFTMNFGSYLCSGNLLADGDPATQVPYFYGGNHCFENSQAPYKTAAQMQAVANTLNTYWFFEAAACRSATPTGFIQRAGGAQFLYNQVANDVLFLRLVDAPPAGAYFTGWDANPVTAGQAIATFHHPNGDLKKYAEGSVLRFTNGFTTPTQAGSYIEVSYSAGTTDIGSSGAGVWTVQGGEYLLRGGLQGGNAFCSNLSGSDYFSRFDLAYPALASFLNATAPFANFTDLWYNAAESGWGLSLVQHSANTLFGVWYTYDAAGKPLWVVMPGGQWTSSSTFTGTLYTTAGPHQMSSFDPSLVRTNAVGSATLTFSGANNGTWAWTINGQSGSKAITRQGF